MSANLQPHFKNNFSFKMCKSTKRKKPEYLKWNQKQLLNGKNIQQFNQVESDLYGQLTKIYRGHYAKNWKFWGLKCAQIY